MPNMNLTPLGVAFTDLELPAAGVLPYQLDHDYFIDQDLVIRTAAGGGGSTLIPVTDYVLTDEDTALSAIVSAAVGSSVTCSHHITIVTPAYQGVPLFHSGKYVADSKAAEDVQYQLTRPVVSANFTMRKDDRIGRFDVTTGAAERTGTMALGADCILDGCARRVTFRKVDSGVGELKLTCAGADKFFYPGNAVGVASMYVGFAMQSAEFEACAGGWVLVRGVCQPVALEPDIGGGWHKHFAMLWAGGAYGAGWYAVDVSSLPVGVKEIYIDMQWSGPLGGSMSAFTDSTPTPIACFCQAYLQVNNQIGVGNGEVILTSGRIFAIQISLSGGSSQYIWMQKYRLGPA